MIRAAKSELREVRSTIEAYSKKATIGGYEQASACGLYVVGATFRLTDAHGVTSTYKIDRME